MYSNKKKIVKLNFEKNGNLMQFLLVKQLIALKNINILLYRDYSDKLKHQIFKVYTNKIYTNWRLLQFYNLNYGKFFFFHQRKFDIFSYYFFNKFTNRYMFQGQRYKILTLFNTILIQFKFKANLNFQKFFKMLLFLIRPLFGYVRRRKAKQIFIVPVPIK